MVWKPVLVSVDAHEVLQVDRQTHLLMRLELWQADHAVGVEESAGNEILVTPGAVMLEQFASIVFASVESVGEVIHFAKGGMRSEIYADVAGRVAGQGSMPDDHAVDLVSGFLPEIVDLEGDPDGLPIESRDVVEPGYFADALEIGVVLWRVGNDEPSAPIERDARVVEDGSDDGAMRNETLSIVGVAFAKVAHEVGFQDNGVTRSNPRAQGIPAGRTVSLVIQVEESEALSDRGIHLVGE
jgi:hypothetical protein